MENHPTETSQGREHFEECLTSTISKKLHESARKAESLFSSACIYRVPEELRKLKASAYTPRLIAIGPLHRDDPHLQTPMQQVKMSYANHLLCRLTKGVEDRQAEQERFQLLKECVSEMKKSIDNAKKCYAEEVKLDVEMMLIDGCFILELLYRNLLIITKSNRRDIVSSYPIVRSDCNGYSEGVQPTDPIFCNKLVWTNVYYDLLLVENQIPYIVLEKLFPLTLGRIPIQLNPPSLYEYLARYFGKKMRPERNDSTRYYHILHKVHDGYLPPDTTEEKEDYKIMHSATELVYAGVKFRPSPKNEVQLLKVKFNKHPGPFWWCRSALFEIPELVIDDSTESFLWNHIAFEQTCPGIPQHFTSYAILLDMLVDSANDVQVLEKAGVVRNYLGASEDAKNLFNNLCKEVVEQEFFYADICNRAHEYRRSFWPKHIADVRRQYFASPWKFIAFCLAFCAVAISVTQFLRSFNYK